MKDKRDDTQLAATQRSKGRTNSASSMISNIDKRLYFASIWLVKGLFKADSSGGWSQTCHRDDIGAGIERENE
jgi:hypothetical protein